LGGAPLQAHLEGGFHHARFKSAREALRSRFKVKPQWGAVEDSVLKLQVLVDSPALEALAGCVVRWEGE
jgi:hypothetical protein